jgi:DNA-directed RNA polymerase
MQDLIAAQAALEQESSDLGVQRYERERQKDETNTRPGQRLLVESIKPLAGAITEWVERVTSGRPTPHANLGYLLGELPAVDAAYITAKRVIAGMVKHDTLQTVAFSVAATIEDAVNFDRLKEENPRAYRLLQRKIANSSAPGYRHVVMRKQLKYAGLKAIKWGTRDRLQLGLLLIDLMEQNVNINGAPMFHKTLQSGTRALDSRYILMPTDSMVAWLEASHERCAMLAPVHLPMVVEPKAWTTPFDGGYLSPKSRYCLMKARGRDAYMSELQHYTMPRVYAAVNALQSTPWRVNKAVLAVLREAWETNEQVGGLPPRDPLPIPPNAPEGATEAEIAASKAAKALAYAANVKLMSKRLALASKVWMADKFAAFERIYFPHALDWRGRAYPVVSFLHPQADDSGKALLEFAEGVPLGPNGGYWLAVQGANCAGIDKVAFDERVQWVLDNEEAIIASAVNPTAPDAFWKTITEAPWRFLAFCFEWAGYVMSGRSEDFVSHQPVSFDGSCNGLQNYSMMLRDEVGGAATNLVPAEKPSDIYTQVAQALEADLAQDDTPLARAWRGKVIRKVAKQPTMTMPYGAGQYGYRQQIMDALRKIEDETGAPHLNADVFEASGFLAGKMRGALGKVVVKAAEAMDWLQQASRIAAEDGLPIRWETPVGLPVVQDYREMVGERIETEITGTKIKLTVTREGDKLDKRRQAQGIAPNFVHSLDAAHMMATVGLALEEGITAFAMVHDSYGAHAGHADRLNVLLRQAFVEQYTPDVLGRFRDELVGQLPPKLAAKIPPLPTYGTLDVAAVMHSEYFFA